MTRRDLAATMASYRRLLPNLRRAGEEIARSAELHGEYCAVPTSRGDCVLSLHRAPAPGAPVVVELHGGGFSLGTVAADDRIRELLRDQAGCAVLGVGYCLAPEHPYPAALDQLAEVLDVLAARADEWGVDPARVALLGFSAGANLATVLARRHPRRVAAQVLHYPFLDAVTPSAAKSPQPWDISQEMMEVFHHLYATDERLGDSEVSPVYTPVSALAGLPPALIVTAGRDALKPEAEVYAALLESAGVPVMVQDMPHAHHGYIEQWLGPRSPGAAGDDTIDPRSEAEALAAIATTARFLTGVFGDG